MPNGDVILLDQLERSVLLLDAQVGTSDGVWVGIGTFGRSTIHITANETGAVFRFHLSNKPVKPLNSDSEYSLISNQWVFDVYNANGPNFFIFLQSFYPARWAKVSKTAGASPVASTAILYSSTQR